MERVQAPVRVRRVQIRRQGPARLAEPACCQAVQTWGQLLQFGLRLRAGLGILAAEGDAAFDEQLARVVAGCAAGAGVQNDRVFLACTLGRVGLADFDDAALEAFLLGVPDVGGRRLVAVDR
ncbi:MAG: hypothetical protein J0626_03920, partial [Rhodospirillaceae bacterium]|nr:hypothetical protein [Rhodospirillaceae bacterium]